MSTHAKEDWRYVRIKGGHVHQHPAFEQCNTDDALPKDREKLTEDEALAIGAKFPDLMCRHCFPALVGITDEDVSAD